MIEKDARIFVAGHRGMVGSALVRRLRAGCYSQIVLRARRPRPARATGHETLRSPDRNFASDMNTTVIGKNVTFRAHAADASHLRNSKVIDIIAELGSSGIEVTVHDPEADAREAMHEYGVQLARWDELPRADAIVAAVAHRSYHELSTEEICGKSVKGGSFIDVKAGFDKTSLIAAVMRVWRL